MLSKLNTRTIFYSTIFYIISLVSVKRYYDFIFILPFIFIQLRIFSIDFSKLKKVFIYSIGLFLSMIFINYFLMERDINYIITSLFRLISIIFLSVSLVSFMNIKDIGYAIESLLWPLKFFKFPVESVGIITALGLKFIPMLKNESERILLCQRARGIDFKLMTLKERILNIQTLFFPIVILGVQNALQTAISMEVRGFGNGLKRTKLKEYSFNKFDWIYLNITLIINIIFIFVME